MFLKKIREARIESGLSMADCCVKLGLSAAQLWDIYERGVRYPKLDRAKEMTKAVGLFWKDMAELYEEEKVERKIQRLQAKLKEVRKKK